MKPKALIHIGAGPLQIEGIQIAKNLGLYVVITDKNPKAPGRELADDFHCISGNDEKALVSLALDLKEKFDVIGAYGSNDLTLLPIAKINEVLGLKSSSYEDFKKSLDKYMSKEIWLKNSISTPYAIKIDKSDSFANEKLDFPIIVKPKDSCGSQGIVSIERQEDLPEAVDNAFRYSKEVLLENYLEGKHYDTIGIIWDGEFIPLGIGNRYFAQDPYHFPIWGHSPSDLSDNEIKDAYELTKKAALALDLNFTPVKADIIYSENTFYIIEIAPRFHGDVFTTKMIPYSCSVKPLEVLFELYKGNKIDNRIEYTDRIIWKAIFPKKELKNLNWLDGKVHYKDVFFNERKTFKANHKDNTSLQGFIWFEVPKENSFLEYYEIIDEKIKEYVL